MSSNIAPFGALFAGVDMIDPNYIGKSLDNRLHEVHDTVARRIAVMTADHNSKGALNSGATISALGEIAVDVAKSAVADACKFAFEYTGEASPEIVGRLRLFTDRVKSLVHTPAVQMSGRLGLNTVANDHMAKVRAELDRVTDQLLSDFEAGMHGSERLKRDPVVSIVNSQSNSPGAIQQVGVGTFSQTAFNQHHAPLIEAIDAALDSDEFKGLSATDQEGFKDIAEVVRAEASKQTPDSGKLQRWSTRLLQFAQKAGMKVAENALIQVLVKIFIG